MKIKKHIKKKGALHSMAKDPPSEFHLQKKENKGELIIYESADNQAQVEVKFEKETVWLTQQQIADVFGTQRPAITKHLNNIFKSGELKEKVVSSILEHTTIKLIVNLMSVN